MAQVSREQAVLKVEEAADSSPTFQSLAQIPLAPRIWDWREYVSFVADLAGLVALATSIWVAFAVRRLRTDVLKRARLPAHNSSLDKYAKELNALLANQNANFPDICTLEAAPNNGFVGVSPEEKPLPNDIDLITLIYAARLHRPKTLRDCSIGTT